MTVTANKETRVIVSNTGFSNPIEIDQYVEQSSHLKVYADDVELALGVDYTVDTTLPADGVEITITATGLLHAPDQWVVFHDPPMEQGADLSLGGRFGLAYEQALDALARRLQTMNDKVKRGLRLPINTDLDVEGGEFPVAVADNIIGWNAGGTRLENKGTVPQLATIATIAAQITAVAAKLTEIEAVANNQTNIDIVAGLQTAVNTLAGLNAAIAALYAIRLDITALNANSANIDTVAGDTVKINYLASIAAELNTLYSLATQINTLAGLDTELAAIYAALADIQAAVADLPSLSAKLNTDGSNVGDDTAKSAFLAAIGIDTSGGGGALFYLNASGLLVPLPKGLAGQFLRQNAALTAPEWAWGWELISSVTPSDVANVSWTGLGAFRALRLEGFVRPATDGANFFLRSSINNGVSYDSGATDYGVVRMSQQTTTVGGASTTAAFLPLNVGISIGNGAAEGLMFDVQIEQFNQATYMWVQGTNVAIDTTGSGFQEKIGGFRTNTTARNALAVAFTSGNIAAGRIDLWGRRG